MSWLGVTMHVTRDAIEHTLADLGRLTPGTELIVEYLLPKHLRDEADNAYAALIAETATDGGEPWLSYFTPDDMTAMLTKYGFGPTRHLRRHDAIDTALWHRTDHLHPAELMMLAHTTLT
ncbi:hypothetical protein [Amycolatopsis jejuensis]|uniref:hypothetical protein n=1 Tax=Amycolatopsis jejuensis TaxID=330084 RepID=UPI00068A41A0|nr:hypothetical protein [Amycolatopsis jejuensis]